MSDLRFHNGVLVDPKTLEYGSTLVINNVKTDDHGYYMCRFNNDAFTATSDVALLHICGK